MSIRTINVTAGGVEYVTVDFEAPDHDISADTLQLALVPVNTPIDDDTVWTNAVNTTAEEHKLTGSILVDNTYAPGTYRVHGRLADSQEVVIRSDALVTVV